MDIELFNGSRYSTLKIRFAENHLIYFSAAFIAQYPQLADYNFVTLGFMRIEKKAVFIFDKEATSNSIRFSRIKTKGGTKIWRGIYVRAKDFAAKYGISPQHCVAEKMELDGEKDKLMFSVCVINNKEKMINES